MEYHQVTQPNPQWLEINKNNSCLLYWPQLLRDSSESLVVYLPKSDRPTIHEKIQKQEKRNTIRQRLLLEFAHRLRTIHKVDFPDSYWAILLSPWMTSALSNYLCRIDILEQSLRSATISSTCVIESDRIPQITNDTTEYFHILHDQLWRSRQDRKILEYLEFRGEIISKDDTRASYFNMESSEKSIIQKGKERLQTISMKFASFNSIYLENTYLPPSTEARLQVLLGQLPVSNRSIDWKNHIDINDLTWPHRTLQLPLRKMETPLEDREKFLLDELWSQMPRIFLEYYGEVRELSLDLMPKKARCAFTSNSFHQNEAFKFWVAESRIAGMTYIVGQHGNNYGANILTSPTSEESLSDFFLTWGWRSSNPKFIPSTCFNIAERPHTSCKDGGLLLLSRSAPGEDQAFDETKEYYDQLEQQHDFVDQLELNIQSSTTIRITPLNSRIGDHLPNSWSNDIGRCSLDFGKVSYQKIRTDYRLAVFSYDSSGLLEGLASNTPTMGFWLDGLDHLNDFAKGKYQYLIDAEMIFFDSKKCASKVNDIWEDISGWWNSSKVQSARINFCKDFCESSQNPASVIASAIREALDSRVHRY